VAMEVGEAAACAAAVRGAFIWGEAGVIEADAIGLPCADAAASGAFLGEPEPIPGIGGLPRRRRARRITDGPSADGLKSADDDFDGLAEFGIVGCVGDLAAA